MISERETEAVLDRAWAHLERGAPGEALEETRLLAGEPMPSSQRGRALATQVIALEELDRGEDAQNLIEDAMVDEADDFAFVLSAGMAFSELGEHDYAEIFVRNLCDLDPNNAVPWHNYAIVLGRMERYEEAVRAYRHAIERDPTLAPAFLQMAYCLQLLGDDAEAIEAYQRYLDIEPEDGDAWGSLAMLLSARGDTAGAYRAYDIALEAGADPENVQFNRGLTAAQEENTPVVEEALDELEEIAPNAWRTWILRGELLDLQKRVDEAAPAFEAAFASAATEADPEAAAFAAASAFRFALRNELAAFADRVEAHVFEQGHLTEDILELLRLHRGETATAASYQVVLDEGAGEGWVYGVYATSPEDAERRVHAFHRQAQFPERDTHSVQQLSEPGEVVTGIYWRTEGPISLRKHEDTE